MSKLTLLRWGRVGKHLSKNLQEHRFDICSRRILEWQMRYCEKQSML